MIDANLMLKGVLTAVKIANRRGVSHFKSSTQTPSAGADVRRYGVDKTAMAYGLRQEMDKFLFAESLTAVVEPTPEDVTTIIGSHRRRWKG
jgi:hypothetical protein